MKLIIYILMTWQLLQVTDRQSRCFVTCGTNDITDCSDSSTGSQLHELNDAANVDVKEKLLEYYYCFTITTIWFGKVRVPVENPASWRWRLPELYTWSSRRYQNLNSNDKLRIIEDCYYFVLKRFFRIICKSSLA